jgi:anti-anti-sigma factor
MESSDDLGITISALDNTPVVTLRGEWDIATKDRLHQALGALRTDRDVVIDLREAAFFDSSALSELIAFQRRLADQGHRLETVVGDSNMRRLLELTNLEKLLGVSPQRERYFIDRLAAASS